MEVPKVLEAQALGPEALEGRRGHLPDRPWDLLRDRRRVDWVAPGGDPVRDLDLVQVQQDSGRDPVRDLARQEALAHSNFAALARAVFFFLSKIEFCSGRLIRITVQ
ncbi:hypothetical protein JOD24_000054 [Kroppenstedtia sanguinis]|uniref:Uncharacterized protein n=1 Tax=Kroppenstedtia sanguinis TaxID=1380684 RepID=A0ABW4C5J4_9BACL